MIRSVLFNYSDHQTIDTHIISLIFRILHSFLDVGVGGVFLVVLWGFALVKFFPSTLFGFYSFEQKLHMKTQKIFQLLHK